jgi:uncharacterized membrane protein
VTRDSEPLVRLEHELGRLLFAGVAISAVALAAGVVLLLVLPDSAAASALLTGGLLVLTATPILRVVVSIVEYLRMKEYAFAGVTLLVLIELALGVAYALWRG